MRTNGIAGLAVCAALFTAGCSGFLSKKPAPVGPSYASSKPRSPRGDAALVYVMRYKAEPRTSPATILVDGAEVAALSQWGFTWFYVRPGSHRLGVRWEQASGQRPAELAVEVAAGRPYYFEVTGVSKVTGAGESRRSDLEEHNAFDIQERLAACGYQKARTDEPVP